MAEAYWTHADILTLVGAAGTIATVALPFLLSWRKGTFEQAQAIAADMQARQQRLDADERRVQERLEGENAALRAEIASLRTDRDHGWNKARASYERYRDALHRVRNADQRIEGLRFRLETIAATADPTAGLRALLAQWSQQPPVIDAPPLEAMDERTPDEFRYLPESRA